MQSIPYLVSVGAGVAGRVSYAEFASEVSRVLQDPRGWRKYGYNFYQIGDSGAARPGVLHIHLEPATVAAELCGRPGFSCWREDTNEIVINLTNWLGGSASRLPLDRYHNYVICHEVGHSLGLEHQKCPIEECRRRGMKSCPASVMQQMTRGPEAVSPCVESDWPLDPDWKIDDPRRLEKARTRTVGTIWTPFGHLSKSFVTIVAIVLMLLLVIVAFLVPAKRGAVRSRLAIQPQIKI